MQVGVEWITNIKHIRVEHKCVYDKKQVNHQDSEDFH